VKNISGMASVWRGIKQITHKQYNDNNASNLARSNTQQRRCAAKSARRQRGGMAALISILTALAHGVLSDRVTGAA